MNRTKVLVLTLIGTIILGAGLITTLYWGELKEIFFVKEPESTDVIEKDGVKYVPADESLQPMKAPGTPDDVELVPYAPTSQPPDVY